MWMRVIFYRRKPASKINQNQRAHSWSEAWSHGQFAYSCYKRLNPGKAKTLAIESNWRRRTIREALGDLKCTNRQWTGGSGRPVSVPFGILYWRAASGVCVSWVDRYVCIVSPCIVSYSLSRCDLFRSLSASKARTDILYLFFLILSSELFKNMILTRPRPEPPSHDGGAHMYPPANSKTTQRIYKREKTLDRY